MAYGFISIPCPVQAPAAHGLVIFLDGKNILPDLSIEIASLRGAIIVLHPDPIINTVRYEER